MDDQTPAQTTLWFGSWIGREQAFNRRQTCARWVYGHPDNLAKWRPDYWISDLHILLPRG